MKTSPSRFLLLVGLALLVAASVARAEGILVVPGEDEEAEEKILVVPGREQREQADDQVAPAPGEPVYPRSAPIVEEGMRMPESRQEGLERPGARQDEMERGGGRQEDLELPDGPGIKY
jgi:hypothetical protein